MDTDDSKSQSVNVRLQGPGAIHDATTAARDFGAAQALSHGDATRLVIMIEELVTNLYDHGGVTEDDDIGMALSVSADGVLIMVSDPGTCFDPRTAPLFDGPPPERGGGAGIDLVMAWGHVLDYRTADGRNQLDLLMPRRDGDGAAA